MSLTFPPSRHVTKRAESKYEDQVISGTQPQKLFTVMCINKKSLPFSSLLQVQKVYCFLCPQTSFPQCSTKDVPLEGLDWKTNPSSKINCSQKKWPEKNCVAHLLCNSQ